MQGLYDCKLYAEARQDLEQALRVDERYGVRGAYALLDRCATQQQDWQYKMHICKRWAEAAPDAPGAINHYAWALLTCTDKTLRDYKRALMLAEKAAQGTDNKDSNVLDTLALAQFENGKIAEAIATQKKAIALMPRSALQRQRDEFGARLAQFESALQGAEK